MKKYEFLDHTADVKFLAYGKTLEEAFSNAALASYDVMTDVKKVKPVEEKTIEIKSKNKQSLLYDFLEELIVLTDMEGFLLSKVKEIEIKQNKDNLTLKATILGDNGDNYDVHTYLKSVTYNDMFIKETKTQVTIQVVHDI